MTNIQETIFFKREEDDDKIVITLKPIYSFFFPVCTVLIILGCYLKSNLLVLLPLAVIIGFTIATSIMCKQIEGEIGRYTGTTFYSETGNRYSIDDPTVITITKPKDRGVYEVRALKKKDEERKHKTKIIMTILIVLGAVAIAFGIFGVVSVKKLGLDVATKRIFLGLIVVALLVIFLAIRKILTLKNTEAEEE